MRRSTKKTGQNRDKLRNPGKDQLVNGANAHLDYISARLSKGKVWFVEYYAVHPDTGELKRVRNKLQRFKGNKLAVGRQMVRVINEKLAQGWNPWAEQRAAKCMTPLKDVLRIYLDSKARETSNDEFAEESLLSYISVLNIFKRWCHHNQMAEKFIEQFDQEQAADFMYYLEDHRKVGGRTYNGYLSYLKAFFNWAVERTYVSQNHFDRFKRKKVLKKNRSYLTPDERILLSERIQPKLPYMFRTCLFVFHALVRPMELCRITGEMINLEKQVIQMPAWATKSKRPRTVALPDAMFEADTKLWEDMARLQPHEQLFSSGLKPGTIRIKPKAMSDVWMYRVRPLCHWDLDKKLYSLRDTGIRQKFIDGHSLPVVMKLADHSNPETTAEYLEDLDPDMRGSVLRGASVL